MARTWVLGRMEVAASSYPDMSSSRRIPGWRAVCILGWVTPAEPQRDDLRLLSWGLNRRRLLVLDSVAAALIGLILYAAVADPAVHGPTAIGVISLASLPLAVRRLWPIPVFAVTALAVVAALLLGVGSGEVMVAPAFALYTVATGTPRLRVDPTVLIALLTGAGILIAVAGGSTAGVGVDIGRFVLGFVALGAAWLLGRYVAERRIHASSTAEHHARTAVAEERLRISREIHDVVGHAMNLIIVKAAVARHVADVRPEEAAAALDVIEGTSREAMAEVRGLLGALRVDPTDAISVHSLQGIPRLVEQAEAAGVAVETHIDTSGDLPDGLQLAIYRIIQQALTNVAEHAPRGKARVRVEATGDGVEVEVVNAPGRGSSGRQQGSTGRGLGLVGMKERAALYGGELRAGARADGGFRVAVTFPLEHQDRTVRP